MANIRYVGAVIKGLDALRQNLGHIPDDCARSLLQEITLATPSVPWDSGDLRNSGAAYVGGRFVVGSNEFSTTNPDHWGQNPSYIARDDFVPRKTGLGGHKTFSTFTQGSLKGTKLEGRSLASTINIIFSAPYAEAMHNGSYKPREPGSGPGFISKKLLSFGKEFTLIARKALLTQRQSDALAFKRMEDSLLSSSRITNGKSHMFKVGK